MKKILKYEIVSERFNDVCKSLKFPVHVKITEQSHIGYEFGNNSTTYFYDIMESGIYLNSIFYPENGFENGKWFFVRGTCIHRNDNVMIFNSNFQLHLFENIVKAYNKYEFEEIEKETKEMKTENNKYYIFNGLGINLNKLEELVTVDKTTICTTEQFPDWFFVCSKSENGYRLLNVFNKSLNENVDSVKKLINDSVVDQKTFNELVELDLIDGGNYSE